MVSVAAVMGAVAKSRGTVAVEGGGGVSPDMDLTWSDYANIAAFTADDDPWDLVEQVNADEMALDTEIVDTSIGETKSLRYHYNHGGTGASSITIGNAFVFPEVKQEAWAEFRIRWSTNFTTEWAAAYPNDHKLIFGDTQSSESGRWAIYVGNGSGTHAIRFERPSATGGTGDYALDPGGEPTAETLWTSDTWHSIRVYLKHSTTTSSADGAEKLWVDEELHHDLSGFNTVASEGGVDRLQGFSFCHNKDDGPTNTDMYIYWSRVRVWFSDPGWS